MARFALALLAVFALLFGATTLNAQQATTPPAPPPAPPFGTPIKLDQAVEIANAAIAEAKKINVPMAIAVTEPSGDLVYFARMENAPYSSIQIAQHKATTAARFRRPTRAFDDQLRAGNMFFLTFDVNAAPGGLPIVREGKLIGAIGVSGGSGAQDEQVGRAGLASP